MTVVTSINNGTMGYIPIGNQGHPHQGVAHEHEHEHEHQLQAGQGEDPEQQAQVLHQSAQPMPQVGSVDSWSFAV